MPGEAKHFRLIKKGFLHMFCRAGRTALLILAVTSNPLHAEDGLDYFKSFYKGQILSGMLLFPFMSKIPNTAKINFTSCLIDFEMDSLSDAERNQISAYMIVAMQTDKGPSLDDPQIAFFTKMNAAKKLRLEKDKLKTACGDDILAFAQPLIPKATQ